MKKNYILITISCLFIFSCTQRPTMVKNNSMVTEMQTNKITKQKKHNASKQNSVYTPYSNNKTVSNNKKSGKIVYAPVIYPSFKGPMYIKPKSVKVEKSNGKIQISVENMPLNEFINLVFGKTLKVSYFLDNRLKKRRDLVTIKMEKPVSYSNFMDMVYAILSRYNISVQKKGGTVFIVPGSGSSTQTVFPRFFIGRYIPKNILPDEIVTIIVPFYYVRAASYISLLRYAALSREAKTSVISSINALMITDKSKNIRSAISLINIFDRLIFEHKQAILVHLDYLLPTDFVNKLKKVLPFEGVPFASNPSQPGITIVPMPELNSILIVSAKKQWTDAVLYWKNKLDTISAFGNQPRFFVYYPQNRRADDLANVFSQVGTSFLKSKNKNVKHTNFLPRNVKVVVDEGRNALVILAPPNEYKQIKHVLDKLDTLPKEVLVQVTIAEITLTKNLQYGIEWYLRHSGKYSGTLRTLGGLNLGSGGINYSLITDTAKFQALLNAYAHKNLINVISSPRLVVLDNHNATINVGTQVPTVTSESTSSNIQEGGTTALIRTITYRNTGVILSIKPTINSGGILTLNINQTVSEPQVNDTSKIDSPLILSRTINTSVVLRSGTTLLLGGLIKKNDSSTINKVPLLGDIPIIGNIFKTTSKGTTKTELIIEITPYIISSINEARTQTRKFESLLEWFKHESSAGYITQ